MKSFCLLIALSCLMTSFQIVLSDSDSYSDSDTKNRWPPNSNKAIKKKKKNHYSVSGGLWAKSNYDDPTPEPTMRPTPSPTEWPTTAWPTPEPTEWPTPEPTEYPTPEPTEWPTPEPTQWPTPEPTEWPTPEPTEWPTPEPTNWPTYEPTNSPIRDVCELRDDKKFDFIVLYDNTCALKTADCDALLEGVGEIISLLLDYPLSRVQTLEFQTNGKPEIIVDFDEELLQKRPNEYVQTIREQGECMEGGAGQIDLRSAVEFAISQFDTDHDRHVKMVIVSACYQMDICPCPLDLDTNGMEVYVVNLIDASKAKNVIKKKIAKKYLLCLTDNNSDRICVGDRSKGVSIAEFDDIIEHCLLPTICTLQTDAPTPQPTEWPTPEPTEWPTPEPTEYPTPEPTEWPTPEPTELPTPEPTEYPTPEPTEWPTPEPTEWPTPEPTQYPTPEPTEYPTPEPTYWPTPEPTEYPTPEPTQYPTPEPTEWPTPEPTEYPTPEPTQYPTPEPTEYPTPEPTYWPTPEPTEYPTPEPTEYPTPEPTEWPTPEPTEYPTPEPTQYPTPEPTTYPTPEPTEWPTPEPTEWPTPEPTPWPTPEPTEWPTPEPSRWPTEKPTPSPIQDICPYEIREGKKFDFIILLDNTCDLQQCHCDNLLEGVGEIISKLLDDTDATRIQTVEMKAHGNTNNLVTFADTTLQNDPLQYVQYVRQYGQCTHDGKGKTDASKALGHAMTLLDVTDDRIDKIIIVSSCWDNKKKRLCKKIAPALFAHNIDVYVVNLIKSSNAKNVITEERANQYLKCVTTHDICLGANEDGVSITEFDDILNRCLLPGVCEPPTASPTPEPTEWPTPEPTEWPTPEPTEWPTPEPTEWPTPEPTEWPTPEPTEWPTPEPTEWPTPEPEWPTPEPTKWPTPEPNEWPTPEPTPQPAAAKWPTKKKKWPTPEPTRWPTPEPTEWPTPEPTKKKWPTPQPTKKKKKKKWPTPCPTTEQKWPTPEPTEWPTPELTTEWWPTPEPTEWPTEWTKTWTTPQPTTPWPTTDPTEHSINWSKSPVISPCTDEMRNNQQIDYVIFIDNSCKLSDDSCDALLSGVGRIILSLLDYPSTRVATMDFGKDKKDVQVVVSLDDNLQKQPSKYIEYVAQKGECTDNGNDETDLISVLKKGIHLFENADDSKSHTFILISACIDNNGQICNKWANILHAKAIDIYVINLIGASDAKNAIVNNENGLDYLSCLTDNVCIGHHDIVSMHGLEEIIDSCLFPYVCIPQNDDDSTMPTPEPTRRPTPTPTKYGHSKVMGEITHIDDDDDGYYGLHGCGNDDDTELDYVLFLDNSCGLNDADCDNLLEGTARIIDKLLDYPQTRISVLQFGAHRNDVDVLVKYDNIELQESSEKYQKYIEQYGQCTQGGNGETNLYQAIKRAQQLIDYNKITAFVIISACKDTTKVCKISNEIHRYGIDSYVVNLLSSSSSHNVFQNNKDANYYLLCFTQTKETKDVCFGDNNKYISVNEFDQIIYNCLLPQLCESSMKNPTPLPTPDPTPKPTKKKGKNIK